MDRSWTGQRSDSYLDMLQTSSPSYVLMASIDYCIHQLETCGGKLWPPYVERLERLRKELAGLRRLKLIQRPDQDPSKLVIQGTGAGMNGRELYKLLLDKYQLQMEMAAGGYVLAMTSPGDTDEGMERLSRALFDIDEMSGLMYNASKPYSEVQYPEAGAGVYQRGGCQKAGKAGPWAGASPGKKVKALFRWSTPTCILPEFR